MADSAGCAAGGAQLVDQTQMTVDSKVGDAVWLYPDWSLVEAHRIGMTDHQKS